MNDKHYFEEQQFWDKKGADLYCSLSVFDQRRLGEWIGWAGGGRVLDIGGGSGMVSRLVSREPDTECVCIDISLPMLTHAFVPSVQADALALPFQDGSFDLVVAAAFFHHLPGEEDKLLGEIFRVLKPGGRMVGYDPSANCLQNRIFMMDTPLRLNRFSPDERPIYPQELREHTQSIGFHHFTYKTFSFRNKKVTLFEMLQRCFLSPLAIGPFKQIFDRWFYWETVKPKNRLKG